MNYNQRATKVAKELLGRCIRYGEKTYMITVTEAYPYDESENGKVKPLSYVNRYRKGSKGHDALVGTDKIGTCFVYGGMLHIACAGGVAGDENEYRCDNVLIRGAIRVESGALQEEDAQMNYKTGKPYKLCRNRDMLGIPSNAPTVKLGAGDGAIRICKYKPYVGTAPVSRIGLNDKTAYRYYVPKKQLVTKKDV